MDNKGIIFSLPQMETVDYNNLYAIYDWCKYYYRGQAEYKFFSYAGMKDKYSIIAACLER